MNKQNEDFETFKNEGIDFITRMIKCLRGAPIVGVAFSKEIDELEVKASTLLNVSTREEWKTVVDNTINPLFASLDRELAFRFDISVDYVLDLEGFRY